MPQAITTTNWTDLGFTTLDEPVSYPYTRSDTNESSVIWDFSEGPEGLNKGDILRLQMSTLVLKVDGEYVAVGAVGPDGLHLKPSTQYVETRSVIPIFSEKDYSTIEEAEQFKQVPREIASIPLVLKYYSLVQRRF